MGKDECPEDINAAYSLLVNYRTQMNARARNQGVYHPADDKQYDIKQQR
jgi:hypothetical protein